MRSSNRRGWSGGWSGGVSRSRRASRNRFVPGFTALEGRQLLATFNWVASTGGAWSDSANWKDQAGKPGVPGAGDTAVIAAKTIDVEVDGPVSVASLQCSATLSVDSGSFRVANSAPRRSVGSTWARARAFSRRAGPSPSRAVRSPARSLRRRGSSRSAVGRHSSTLEPSLPERDGSTCPRTGPPRSGPQ
jgi:hypothetical protein